MATRESVIAKCEKNYAAGRGVRLSHEELGTLFAKPSPAYDDPDVKPEPSHKTLDVDIRWLVSRDYPEVLEIERKSYARYWTEEYLVRCLRQRNCVGLVAQHAETLVGFTVYELHKSRIRILKFAVDPEWRRQRVGQQMFSRLVNKLSQQRRNEIRMEVRETNTDALLFLRAQGCRFGKLLREHYDDTGEDAVLMRFKVKQPKQQST